MRRRLQNPPALPSVMHYRHGREPPAEADSYSIMVQHSSNLTRKRPGPSNSILDDLLLLAIYTNFLVIIHDVVGSIFNARSSFRGSGEDIPDNCDITV